MGFSYRGDRAWLVPHPQAGWGDGITYGAARLPGLLPRDPELMVLFSGGEEPISEGWEHVSVSTKGRTPTWEEMVRVKRLFWHDEDCVLQFHPPRSEYVNVHSYCLHLWRHATQPQARPPRGLVG